MTLISQLSCYLLASKLPETKAIAVESALLVRENNNVFWLKHDFPGRSRFWRKKATQFNTDRNILVVKKQGKCQRRTTTGRQKSG